MKILASLAVLAAATIGSASASIINFNTVGSLFTTVGGSPNNTNTFTVNSGASSATVTYFNVVAASTNFDDASPGSNIQLGVFQTTYLGTDVSIVIPSFTFVLHINETSPFVQAGTSTNTAATSSSSGGSISLNSSNVNISFAPTTLTLGQTLYTVFNPTPLVAPTTGSGYSTIQGNGIGVGVPEPGTMFLLGAGLIGVGFSARKKFLNRS